MRGLEGFEAKTLRATANLVSDMFVHVLPVEITGQAVVYCIIAMMHTNGTVMICL